MCKWTQGKEVKIRNRKADLYSVKLSLGSQCRQSKERAVYRQVGKLYQW